MKKYIPAWNETKPQYDVRYKCGYCGVDTAPSWGWQTSPTSRENMNMLGLVLICTSCNRPTFIEIEDKIIVRTTPSAKMGNEVLGLPQEVLSLYDEARKCTGAGAFTAAVLVCRKILMHVAVEKGASKGKGFFEYVEYLANKSYIPQDGKVWVDYIRTKSNEANHEIIVMEERDAEDLITFTEMLLRIVYEFKHRLPPSQEGDDTVSV